MMELRSVSKRFGEIEALRDMTLEIERGEVITVLGPNGSGKSTLLRILAALEQTTSGEVLFDGKNVDLKDKGSWRKRTTLVFQRPVVLRGSVFDNVAYGLRQRGLSNDEIEERVSGALHLLGLDALAERNAKSLSGGEKQRLSIARAVVLETDLLLLDEPTVNLDPESLDIVKKFILGLRERPDITVVLATHDMEIARELSDKVLLLSGGRVVEIGSTRDLMLSQSTEMARFARTENVFTGVSKRVDGVSRIDVDGVVIVGAFSTEGSTTVNVRPEDIIVSRRVMASSARNNLRGKIIGVEELEAIVRLRVDVGVVFTVQITRRSLEEMGLNVGQEVYITFKASSVRLL
ncbi:ABC transporter ATP-binding protein [Candidatus Bathyarchaeota archaeon]|nr:ABC transporter ATP-binding protein [Candidatus Bathyarchaeota archaeon]MBL7078692.1 ABC transporter ATP-binding protein [Candidatus Bathyarchaeota archaeon]